MAILGSIKCFIHLIISKQKHIPPLWIKTHF